MTKTINCVSLRFTDEEMRLLDEAWRADFSFKNRSEFIKTAINHQVKRTICLPQRRGSANRLAD